MRPTDDALKNEILYPEAVITVKVDFTDGDMTGTYKIRFFDYLGDLVFEHTIEGRGEETRDISIDYIAEKVHRNTKRFKGLTAKLYEKERIFEYRALDKKRIEAMLRESPLLVFSQAYDGDIPDEFKTVSDDVFNKSEDVNT